MPNKLAIEALKECLDLVEATSHGPSIDGDLRSKITEALAALSVEADEPVAWVSVKDRLPTHIYSVLGYVIDGPLTANGTSPMRDIVSYCPDSRTWLQNVGDDDAVVTVTHWMSLPSAPQALADQAQELDMGYGHNACPTCGKSQPAPAQTGVAELERQVAELRKQAERAIKDAYYEGFFARATYNDIQLNDEDAEFNESSAKIAIAALASSQQNGGV